MFAKATPYTRNAFGVDIAREIDDLHVSRSVGGVVDGLAGDHSVHVDFGDHALEMMPQVLVEDLVAFVLVGAERRSDRGRVLIRQAQRLVANNPAKGLRERQHGSLRHQVALLGSQIKRARLLFRTQDRAANLRDRSALSGADS